MMMVVNEFCGEQTLFGEQTLCPWPPPLCPPPEKKEEAPAELVGLYQHGVYRPMYANPDGSMLIFTQDGEEPAKEEKKEAAPEAKEGEEKKEEKKAAEEEVVDGEDLEQKKPDLNDPTRNNVVSDGN